MHRNPTHRRKGTHLTRQGRYSSPGQIYHVITSTYDRQPEFSDFAAGRIVVKTLMQMAAENYASTLGYVVMPDHMHWLMQLGRKKKLSACVGIVKAYSARLINQHKKCTDAIWSRGFFERAIRREDDIPAVARYIVANPLRAGLVERVGDYPHWDSIWMV